MVGGWGMAMYTIVILILIDNCIICIWGRFSRNHILPSWISHEFLWIYQQVGPNPKSLQVSSPTFLENIYPRKRRNDNGKFQPFDHASPIKMVTSQLVMLVFRGGSLTTSSTECLPWRLNEEHWETGRSSSFIRIMRWGGGQSGQSGWATKNHECRSLRSHLEEP